MAGQSAPDSKLIQIGMDTEAVTDAWSKIWEKASSGVADTIKDPSVIGFSAGLMKDIVMSGSAFFKFFGVADSINEFRKLWGWGADKSVKEKNKKHSLPMKIGLSSLYILHAAASSLVACVILGASVVAAPIATAIVSSVAFAKSVGEFFKVRSEIKHRKKDVQEAEDALKSEHVDLERNIALRNDLTQSREELDALKSESEELGEKIKFLQTTDEPEDDPEKIQKIVQALEEESEILKSSLNEKIDKNKIIVHQSEKPDAYSKRTIEQSIITANNKIESFNKHKENLLSKIAQAKTDPQQTDRVVYLQQELKKVDDKIQKHTILKEHFEKIKSLEGTAEDLLKQKGQLESKYSNPPYNGKRDDLKSLEKEYLELRIKELDDKIKAKKNPNGRHEKVAALEKTKNEIEGAQKKTDPKQRRVELESILKENFEKEKKLADKKFEDKQKKYDSKEKYVELFTSDPNKDIKNNIKKIFEKTSNLIDKKIALKKAKLDKIKKTKNVLFAAGVAALAIASCVVWPLAATFAGVMLGIGIVSGISSLWDRHQNKKLDKKSKKEKEIQLGELEEQLKQKDSVGPKKSTGKDMDNPPIPTTPLPESVATSPSMNGNGQPPIVDTASKPKGMLHGYASTRDRANSTPETLGRNAFLKSQTEPEKQTPTSDTKSRTRSTSM